MMNKKILLSVVAAATIGSVFTGCGSDSATASGTSVSGVAQKAALEGSTVTIGADSDTTDADGKYTVANASGTDVLVTDGWMNTKTGKVYNTIPLKAKYVAGSDVVVSMATTLILELMDNDDTLSQANAEQYTANLLGLELTELYSAPDTLTGTLADVNEMKNRQALVWQLLTSVGTSTKGMNGLITSLAARSTNQVDLVDFATVLGAAMDAAAAEDTTLADALATAKTSIMALASEENMILNEEDMLDAASAGETTVTVTAWDNVLNLDTSNYTFETHGMIDTNHNLSYTAVSDINLQEPSMFDGDDLHPASADLYFSLVDLTTVAPTGETGTMTIEMKDLNGNASYKMSLSNLTVTSATSAEDDNNYVTLGMNENVSVSISAISDMNVSTHFSNSDLNITALCETNLIDSEEDGIELNLATFARYVRLNAEEDSSETNGNFSTAMVGNGNYSIKVNADFNSKSMSFGEGTAAYNKAPKYTTTVDGEEYTGYKILDANLNK